MVQNIKIRDIASLHRGPGSLSFTAAPSTRKCLPPAGYECVERALVYANLPTESNDRYDVRACKVGGAGIFYAQNCCDFRQCQER
jgi:hypothetical protein